MIRVVLMAVFAIPLALQMPYLFSAWSGSRLDQFDWLFYLLSIPAAIWALRPVKAGKCDYYALLLLLPMLLLALGSNIHHINALSVAASVGVIFAAVWLLGSWNLAYRVLPAAGILLLGTPSSSYQMSLLLMCQVPVAWGCKFLLAILFLFWIWGNKRFAWQINKGILFFSAALLVTGFLLLHTKELYFEGRSFIPDFTGRVDEFWGRKIEPDANAKRFFATSIIRQYRYTAGNTDISVLAVQCGENIHEIHPASHCLRTSMWNVQFEKIVYLADNLAVTEIYARKGSDRVLVWVWYSSEKFSTPGFLGFRRHFQPGGRYFTCQVSVPVYENVEKSRSILQKFIKSLKEKNNE